MPKFIPHAMRARIPIYLKSLKRLQRDGVDKIMSRELSDIIRIESTTIRRDFSYIGDLGRQGYGYDVNHLISVFENEFDLNNKESVILIGVGHMGRALLKYNGHTDSIAKIVAAFDNYEPYIGEVECDIVIQDYRQIANLMPDNVSVAILTVPASEVRSVIKDLLELGIRGFINFSGEDVFYGEDVKICNINLGDEIQKTLYELKLSL